jgi:hypothetical protein
MTTTKTTRLITSLATAAVPALLLAGAGTASASPGDECYGAMMGSFYCNPASQAGMIPAFGSDPGLSYVPVQPSFSLPGCTGGGLAGVIGALSGDGCS